MKFSEIFSKFFACVLSTFSNSISMPHFQKFINKNANPVGKMHSQHQGTNPWTKKCTLNSIPWKNGSIRLIPVMDLFPQPLSLDKPLEKMTRVSWHNQVLGRSWQMSLYKSVLMYIVLPPEASSGLPQKVTEPYIIQKCRYNCKE